MNAGAFPDAEIAWAVHEILARYGHIVDNSEWQELPSVFTADVHLDAQPIVATGFDGVRAYVESFDPRPSHHVLNTILRRDGDAAVHAWSRFLTVFYDQTVATGDYVDVFARTDAGWRISSRRISLRNRADRAPDGRPWRTESFRSWT